jgi:hypothetical protein
MTLGGVSKRTKALYERFYSDRVTDRLSNLYAIFDRMAANIEAGTSGVRLEIDYLALAEIVRSYFFDTIRYKEYHFDPKGKLGDGERIAALLAKFGCKSIDEIDPLSPQWAEMVHTAVNINSSKVAAYTVKWILKCKPVVVYYDQKVAFDPNTVLEQAPGKYAAFLASINEHFALQCAFLALGIDATKVSRRKIDELIYCFRFRAFDESAYFMILSKEYLCSGEGD